MRVAGALFWAFYPRIPGAYEDYGVRAGAKAKQNNLAKEGVPVHEETIFLEDGTVAVVITGQTSLYPKDTIFST